MSYTIPEKLTRIDYAPDLYEMQKEREARRFYLSRAISSLDDDGDSPMHISMTGQMVMDIAKFNRDDKEKGVPKEKRKPIVIYINSPGGDLDEGFPLIAAIEQSETPVYTVNIGQWSSMAFLIGITGHRRLALPYTTFLLHDGSTFSYGTTSKMQDRAAFEKRYEDEVVREHVLRHSCMSGAKYDELLRVEYYMLPQDALSHGFIDEVTTSIYDIIPPVP